MISLSKYMTEVVFETKREHKSTSNSERLEQLMDWLKNKKYTDYVKTLDKMLEDPKAKTLLEDGFGKDLGDIDFEFRPRLIKAGSLIPTQADIDVSKCLDKALTQVDNIKNDFTDKIVVTDMPIVTFRGNYVIDGHHRWAEVAMVNPDGKMLCFDYDAEISPIQMLKAVQGSIAAVLASRDKKQEMPKSKTQKQNIYDSKWTPEKILKYINDTITDEVVEELMQHYPKCNEKSEVVKILADNLVQFKVNNPPIDKAPERAEMPQTDKAGSIEGDKKSCKPNMKGSALNRLKDGKYDKNIL